MHLPHLFLSYLSAVRIFSLRSQCPHGCLPSAGGVFLQRRPLHLVSVLSNQMSRSLLAADQAAVGSYVDTGVDELAFLLSLSVVHTFSAACNTVPTEASPPMSMRVSLQGGIFALGHRHFGPVGRHLDDHIGNPQHPHPCLVASPPVQLLQPPHFRPGGRRGWGIYRVRPTQQSLLIQMSYPFIAMDCVRPSGWLRCLKRFSLPL